MSSEFLPLNSEIFSGKSGNFSTGIEKFCDRIHDPQTSTHSDAAGTLLGSEKMPEDPKSYLRTPEYTCSCSDDILPGIIFFTSFLSLYPDFY